MYIHWILGFKSVLLSLLYRNDIDEELMSNKTLDAYVEINIDSLLENVL